MELIAELLMPPLVSLLVAMLAALLVELPVEVMAELVLSPELSALDITPPETLPPELFTEALLAVAR